MTSAATSRPTRHFRHRDMLPTPLSGSTVSGRPIGPDYRTFVADGKRVSLTLVTARHARLCADLSRGLVRAGVNRPRELLQRRRRRALRVTLPGGADVPRVEAALHLEHRLDDA